MANKTQKMRDAEERIKNMIVKAHRAGLSDRNGNKIVHPVRGTGHTNRCICNWGLVKLNQWPRDEHGHLIGD